MLAVVSQLFLLLKIDVLRDLMNHGWFGWTYSGVAFGAALGVLRNELKVLAMLRTVVLLVLSLIAVPLAVGLVIFLLATAISGPGVLWEATREATPTLLACAAGAFVLTCVLVRQDDAAMTHSRVTRVAALALAIVILPLAVFAAVSLGLRLNQYGLAPERLWGLVTVIVACAWGVGYWGALLRGRKVAWAQRLREANFILAVATCVLALFLALPILNFATISAGNQLHRLESGRVSPEKFDFAALRWDFGDAGRRALTRLAKNSNVRIADLAQTALAQQKRVYDEPIRTAQDFPLRVQPEDPVTRKLVTDYLKTDPWACQKACVALDLGPAVQGGRNVALVNAYDFKQLQLPRDNGDDPIPFPTDRVGLKPNSHVEIRELTKRFIFVDGRPLPLPLED